jgi:type II secretory pathway pseudopilin PulG
MQQYMEMMRAAAYSQMGPQGVSPQQQQQQLLQLQQMALMQQQQQMAGGGNLQPVVALVCDPNDAAGSSCHQCKTRRAVSDLYFCQRRTT